MTRPDKRKPVVLVTHGSFNPVHRGHIDMMMAARAALEKQGRRVVAAEMAITGFGRIHGKNSAALSEERRLQLLQLALQEQGSGDWVTPTDGTDVRSVGEYIRKNALRLAHADVVKVEGSDIVLRYPPRKGALRVVAAREGEHVQVMQALRSRGLELGRDAVVLQPSPALGGLSSTVARRALACGDSAELERCCGAAVAQRLLSLPPGQRYEWVPPGGEEGWPPSLPPPVVDLTDEGARPSAERRAPSAGASPRPCGEPEGEARRAACLRAAEVRAVEVRAAEAVAVPSPKRSKSGDAEWDRESAP